jgi:hypothetical protein
MHLEWINHVAHFATTAQKGLKNHGREDSSVTYPLVDPGLHQISLLWFVVLRRRC